MQGPTKMAVVLKEIHWVLPRWRLSREESVVWGGLGPTKMAVVQEKLQKCELTSGGRKGGPD